MVFIEMRWSLSVTCVCDWRFEPFPLILGYESLLVSWYCFFSSSLIRILRSSSPSLLLFKPLCDRAWACYLWVVSSRLNCRKTIQWWRFNAESLRINANSIEFCWILILEKSRVCVFLSFLWILWFWSVTERREKTESVCVDVALFCRILTLCTIYSLPCVYLIQWACDMWTWTTCVALVDWTEKGLKCNFRKFGTVFENNKNWNWTVLKIGIGHFCN